MKKSVFAAFMLVAGAAISATLSPIQLLNTTGSSPGQAIVSTGPTTPPAWSNVVASALAPVAANTVIANATGSTAAPAAFAMPSCSTGTSALQYTTGTGFTCFTGSAPLASPAFTGTATFSARPTFAGNTPWDSGNLPSPASTTGNLSQFASTTSAQLAGVISNETGTGALVFGTSPTLTTPNIVGTTTNNNAAAESVGEFVSAVSSSSVPLTHGVNATVVSISLAAGDWDVSGTISFLAASDATAARFIATITPTTSPGPGGIGVDSKIAGVSITNDSIRLPTPVMRISLSAPTTINLVAQASFTGTVTADGYIRARRVR